MELKLQLQASDLTDGVLQQRTRRLRTELNRLEGVSADLVEGEAVPGSMGDAMTLATLTVAFVSTGALKALLDVVKLFLEQRRDKTRQVVVQPEQGVTVTISLADLAPDKIQATLERLEGVAKPQARGQTS